MNKERLRKKLIGLTSAYTEFFLLAVNNSTDLEFIDKVKLLRQKY